MTTTKDIHPIFFDVLDPGLVRSQGRPDITKPWWRDDYLWATDGRIVVRCEMPIDALMAVHRDRINAAEFNPAVRLINAASTFDEAASATPREPLLIPPGIDSFIVTETDETVEIEDGWQRRHVVTTKRDTSAAVIWDSGGDAQIKFRRFYLGVLLKHGVTHLSVLHGRDGFTSPALFHGDGFDGLLMPVIDSFFEEKQDVRGVECGV